MACSFVSGVPSNGRFRITMEKCWQVGSMQSKMHHVNLLGLVVSPEIGNYSLVLATSYSLVKLQRSWTDWRPLSKLLRTLYK